MRKILLPRIMTALTVSLLLFVSCSKKETAQVSSSEKQITVRLLTDAAGVDDKSFNAAAWRGILQFYGDTWNSTPNRGALYDVIAAQTQDMYIPILMQTADETYDLVVAAGFDFADALGEVAERTPDQNYLMVDVDWIDLPNVLNVVFAEHEGSYLVGVAAALKAKADGITDPRFGFIGGIADPTITKFEIGYIQGVLSVLPNARFVEYYAGDWGRPDLAKTQAKNWYDSGVYAIYSAAGGTGNGTIAQAKEYRLQGKNVWAIGVDSDQYEEGLYTNTDSAVLTSMIKRVESALLYALTAMKNGTFKGEVITLDLKTDGVDFAATNTKELPQDIVDRTNAEKAKIIAGTIKVAATLDEARATPNFPPDIRAQ